MEAWLLSDPDGERLGPLCLKSVKEPLGFRRFSLRGLKNVRTEWTLVTLAYNLKRLFHMGRAPLAA